MISARDPHRITFQHLLETVRRAHPDGDTDLLELAYDVARDAHEGQKRITGEDFIIHPLAVATYLAEIKLDLPTITAAILHDVVEDTPYSIQEIEKNFGEEIARLVMDVTNLGKLKYRGVERYIENLRKMFVAMAKDLRVIFIKFADRIDNLKTLHVWPKEKQARIARETIEIYAPIANRLSMGEIKGKLEDLSFPYLDPEGYTWTKNILLSLSPQREKYLDEIQVVVEKKFKEQGITRALVQGRRKHLYSLYQKLVKYNRDVSRIYDIIAIRVIVATIPECYAALGVIHELWRPLKGRIKDYIANKKPNGYRSLHTTVFCEGGEIVEFQIRTQKMHEEAEFGVAGHWRYQKGKGGKQEQEEIQQEFDWIHELTQWKRRIRDKHEQLERLKLDVFQSRIFVFTPQGEIIDLPEDATPVDFAYHIHTDIGNQCTSAIVNDEIVSLDTKLKSGDIVQITTDKRRKGPSPDWLKFVKTGTARAKIKSQMRVNLVDWLKSVSTIKKK